MADELEEAVCELEQVGAQILDAWDRNAWPRSTGACMAYGKRCEFLPLCDRSTQPTDEALYRIRKPRTEVVAP
jgi:hypothetical protein